MGGYVFEGYTKEIFKTVLRTGAGRTITSETTSSKQEKAIRKSFSKGKLFARPSPEGERTCGRRTLVLQGKLEGKRLVLTTLDGRREKRPGVETNGEGYTYIWDRSFNLFGFDVTGKTYTRSRVQESMCPKPWSC